MRKRNPQRALLPVTSSPLHATNKKTVYLLPHSHANYQTRPVPHAGQVVPCLCCTVDSQLTCPLSNPDNLFGMGLLCGMLVGPLAWEPLLEARGVRPWCVSWPEAASAECCGGRAIFKGVWWPSPRNIWEFRWQILHSGRLPVQNHTSKLFLPGFGRSTWTSFWKRFFFFFWYGHGRTGRTSGAGPVCGVCGMCGVCGVGQGRT